MHRRKKQLTIACRWLCVLVAALPAALLAIGLPGLVRADDSPVTVAAPLVGEFQIGKQGRFILLPVTLGSRKVFCLVDTGASLSGFDESLKPVLGQPRGHRKLKTPGGSTRVEEFDWPDAKLRDQPLATDRRIVVVDLAEIRQATNDRIYGVIGMDVLRKYRLQIDFDAGWLRFLESLPANTGKLGERIPMEFTDEGAPYFVGSLGDQASDRFLIDTGTQGNSLEATVFDELREQDFVQPERGFANVTLAGELRGRRGKLDRLTVGPFTREGLRVSRINFSSVGLHYLSRFRITFDFPGRCAYLQKGKHYAKPEPCATSGLSILWIDGEPVIEEVRADGPGDRAGVKLRDVLVRVDGRPAAEFDPFALRQVLTSVGGRKVPLTVRRGTHELDVDVVLEDD